MMFAPTSDKKSSGFTVCYQVPSYWIIFRVEEEFKKTQEILK